MIRAVVRHQAIDDFLIECDGQLIYQPCVSPTWDTALVHRVEAERARARAAKRFAAA